jgi:inhibitor of KinA
MNDYIPAGDAAIILTFGHTISPETNAKVREFMAMIDNQPPYGLVDMIPSYNELMVMYDPVQTGLDALMTRLKQLDMAQKDESVPQLVHEHVIPVAYGGEFGQDMHTVADHCGLTPEEIIRIHGASSYLVYMLGFLPGFCYLGGMDSRIVTPRKETPRLKVPAGAVGIAGVQTGIYPIESPGGWQIIGQTPIKLFDPNRTPAFLINPGDKIRFVPISKQEYDRMAQSVKSGTYQHESRIADSHKSK